MKTLSLILAASALATAPLAAHDFWLEPNTFEVEVAQPLALKVRVGEHFVGDSFLPAARSIADFSAHDLEGARPVHMVTAPEPLALVAARHAGVLAIAYESRPSAVTLNGDSFERYLREEGLEHVIAKRAARGESGAPGRELFARSAKSLISVTGEIGAPAPPASIGLPLELVPLQDPYTLSSGSTLSLDLLYQDAPVAGVLVVAMPKADPGAARKARTDDAGRVTLDFDQPGPWLVKAVHMTPAPADSDAEWMSWWASLTFSIPGG